MTEGPASAPGHVQQLNVTLNSDGVVAPLMRAVKTSVDAASIFLNALQHTDVDQLPDMPDTLAQFRIEMKDIDAENRRRMLVNWMLGKGFHDLLRATKQTLEQAYLYVEFLRMGSGRTTWGEFLEKKRTIEQTANKAHFPDLLNTINASLTQPLAFLTEVRSLQKARNCLEHRDGIVGVQDAGSDSELTLTFPYIGAFLEGIDGDPDIPLQRDMRVERDGVVVIRRTTMTKTFRVGQRLEVTGAEFVNIAQGCWMFAIDLQSKLPGTPPPAATQTTAIDLVVDKPQ
jgi:hypothetical protein